MFTSLRWGTEAQIFQIFTLRWATPLVYTEGSFGVVGIGQNHPIPKPPSLYRNFLGMPTEHTAGVEEPSGEEIFISRCSLRLVKKRGNLLLPTKQYELYESHHQLKMQMLSLQFTRNHCTCTRSGIHQWLKLTSSGIHILNFERRRIAEE